MPFDFDDINSMFNVLKKKNVDGTNGKKKHLK